MIGRTIAHYRVKEKLGEGGMGEVYLVDDTSLDRQVALKFLPKSLQQDETAQVRFMREAKAAAALDHPFICKIYETGQTDSDEGFIAMEFVDGETLKDRLAEGPLPLDEALRLASEIAEALELAHQKGIVHRDLKPANIMLTRQGHAKVMDFGLAKRLGNDGQDISTQVTREGTAVGTPAYMSPEQLKGHALDARSDLFSFGVVLYEMLTGVHPFRKPEQIQTITAILHEEPKNVSAYLENGTGPLSMMLGRMLAKDPAERFQSIGEVLAALNDPSASLSVPAQPFPGRWGLLTLILASVLTVALLGWWALQTGTTGTTPLVSSIAVLPLENLSGDVEQDFFVDGMTWALITDLSKIGALKVIARKSAMSYKGSDKPLEEIARELNVEALIEGSVLREGDRISINAQLIEAATGQNLWADRYERNLTSILALQGEVAQDIARQIQVTLLPEEKDLLSKTREVNPEAYEAYLKGQGHWARLTPPDLETALQYYELSLEMDPDYAPAYAGIAMVWSALQQFGFVRPEEARPKAREAALRAVELDPRSAEAQYSLAMVRTWTDWDWVQAETAFRQAIELNPSFADVRAYYSHYLMLMKRQAESLAQMQRAVELDPLNPLLQSLYAAVLVNAAGLPDDAIEQCKKVLRSVPNHPLALEIMGFAYFEKGMHEEAFGYVKAFSAAKQDSQLVDALERGYQEGGVQGGYSRAAELLASRPFATQNTAWHFAMAGSNQEALHWLERALEEHDPGLPYIAVLEAFAGLSREPRFQDTLRRMNFPEEVISRVVND